MESIRQGILLVTILLVFVQIKANFYGLTCFNCQNISRITDCDTVTHCADGEACYIERVLQGTSTTYAKWNLGCRPKPQCSSPTDSHVTCSTCCNGTLCNLEGCSIRGIGIPRGPVCYDCQNAETPQGCTKVRLCHRDQVCQLSQIAHDDAFQNRTYYSSCVLKYACPASAFISPSVMVGKRSQTDGQRSRRAGSGMCYHCCTSDVCNNMECSYTRPEITTPATTTASSIGWSSWLAWSTCTVTCGGGSKFRIRTCADNNPGTKQLTCSGGNTDIGTCNSIPCSGGNTDIGTCNTIPCSGTSPVTGGWGAWGAWSQCPVSCGSRSGIQHRFRHCESSSSGQSCSGKTYDTKLCNNGPCCTGPPSISHASNDARVNLGETVTLHCNTTDHFTKIVWDGPKVVGHTFPDNVMVLDGGYTLVVSGLRDENYGLYRCNIHNECGHISKDIIITA